MWGHLTGSLSIPLTAFPTIPRIIAPPVGASLSYWIILFIQYVMENRLIDHAGGVLDDGADDVFATMWVTVTVTVTATATATISMTVGPPTLAQDEQNDGVSNVHGHAGTTVARTIMMSPLPPLQ
jgi:hypothetical protein